MTFLDMLLFRKNDIFLELHHTTTLSGDVFICNFGISLY